jgi:4-amino-4-deoxy-L-arabinose transferase-like glycosyltransferase
MTTSALKGAEDRRAASGRDPAPEPRRAATSSRLAAAAALHAAIWSLGAWLAVDCLHADTLEIVGWAGAWRWIYPKHPPLATWIAKLVVALPGPDLPQLLAASQTLVLASAGFAWAIARLYAPAWAAALACALFLLSPSASLFAMQYNHNLVLTPFLLATIFFGLRFLERRGAGDAAATGLAAGLAFLSKYEAAIGFLALIALSLSSRRDRSVWREPRLALAVSAFGLLVAPHLAADWSSGAPTLSYAEAARRLERPEDFLESLNQLLDGLAYGALAVAFAAAAFWGTLTRAKPPIAPAARPFALRSRAAQVGGVLLIAPPTLLIALSLATAQTIRQGWLLPLIPLMTTGLALIASERFAPACGGAARLWRQAPRRIVAISAAQLVALALFFLLQDVRGKPIGAYTFDSSEMAESVEGLWTRAHGGRLRCYAAPSRTIAESPLILAEAKPRFVDLSALPEDARPCAPEGGVAAALAGTPEADRLRRLGLPTQTLTVTSEAHLGGHAWRFEAVVVPPASPDLVPNAGAP